MSGEYTDGSTKTFQAAAAIAPHMRVKLNGSFKLAVTGAADTTGIGYLETEALAADEYVPVRLTNASGTVRVVAHAAFDREATLYQAADGRVDDSGTIKVGTAMEAATAQDDIIEMLPMPVEAPAGGVKVFGIPFSDLYVWDNTVEKLPVAAATDDLGLITGTFGTHAKYLAGIDAGGTTEEQYASFMFAMPNDYVSAGAVVLRANAGMLTTVSDGTATLDVECYRVAAPSVDICATAATSINSTTDADKDFTITATNLVAGEVIEVRLHTAVTDAGNAAGGITATINSVAMRCTVV